MVHKCTNDNEERCNVTNGINFGGDVVSGGQTYNGTTALSDLQYLKSIGFTAIRINMPTTSNTTGITNAQKILILAKSLGFYCSWGVVHAATITTTNWAATKTALLAQALLSSAWSVLPDEWMIDNEATLGHDGTITSATIRADMKTMATTVKTYASWRVSFGESEFDQEGNDNIATWNTAGIGSFDYASFHIYDTIANFKTKVNLIISDFGANGYISEWSSKDDFVTGAYTEEQWAVLIAERLAFLKTTNIASAYFYTHRSTDNWYIQGTSNKRLAFSPFISPRRTFYIDWTGNNANVI
jgi:hypothetical protein